ncbi:MAG: AAA family ATPase [Syntrophales bacterium]|nr:AAA family ATPase [Syntrophales bacterium]
MKGINAIAVTDHHDFAFFPYIKRAASGELDDLGQPIPQTDQLIVFPGLELTLASPPCQALLILDSTFPENLLPGVIASLSISANPDTESKIANVVPIPITVAENFKVLYERLSSLDYVRNRFIVFPHVNDTGHKTLLRSGFADFYKSMPCVGGYLDGPVSRLGRGNIDITNGKDRAYGFKSIAIIQTSDNRKATHEDLGKHTTWIKWATPSAEALRQACLAKESRISQDTPVLPPIFITTLDVSNSKFIGRVYLSFNQQYNAVIGGRGTGKSTVLEYLRWGLCDHLSSEDDELPNYQDRRKKLIEKTLLPFDATVQVSFMKNEISHVVRRKANSGEMLLKIGDGEFEDCTEENIRNLLPIQAYSQKQLSSVGVSKSELKRLVYSPIRQALTESDLSFKNLQTDIKASYEKRMQLILLQKEIKRNEIELKSITEQVEKLRKNLQGITEEDRTTIESHESFSIAAQLVEGWMSELGAAADSIGMLLNELENLPTPIPLDTALPPGSEETIRKINTNVTNIFMAVRKELKEMKARISENSSEMVELEGERKTWLQTLEQHNQIYNSAKERSSSQQVTLNQISQLEERGKEIRKSVSEKRQLVNKLGDQEQKFTALADQWILAHKERGDLIQVQCEQLAILSDNNLRATLGRGKGIDELQSILRSILAGSNIRKEKIESICVMISDAPTPVQEWHELLTEFELLASFDLENDSIDQFPKTPKLSVIGFTPNDLKKAVERLNTDNFINLYLVQLEDIPVFEYKTREGEYIDFADASAGQQATSLIHVLLNQEGPPLIIDQPEDDLDNQMVSEIAELVCKSKKRRQLIFTSHNANIVVNGDAELVACCDYRISGDQSNGEIKKEGAIDIVEIRDEITKIMEGGEKAFRLRKEKYGF